AAIVNLYVSNRLMAYPLTEDLGSWTAGPMLFLYGLVLGLALWAARASLAGRPLFKGWLAADWAAPLPPAGPGRPRPVDGRWRHARPARRRTRAAGRGAGR